MRPLRAARFRACVNSPPASAGSRPPGQRDGRWHSAGVAVRRRHGDGADRAGSRGDHTLRSREPGRALPRPWLPYFPSLLRSRGRRVLPALALLGLLGERATGYPQQDDRLPPTKRPVTPEATGYPRLSGSGSNIQGGGRIRLSSIRQSPSAASSSSTSHARSRRFRYLRPLASPTG